MNLSLRNPFIFGLFVALVSLLTGNSISILNSNVLKLANLNLLFGIIISVLGIFLWIFSIAACGYLFAYIYNQKFDKDFLKYSVLSYLFFIFGFSFLNIKNGTLLKLQQIKTIPEVAFIFMLVFVVLILTYYFIRFILRLGNLYYFREK